MTETSPYLTLYFYPSPGLDWSSPWSLTYSTIRNNFIVKRRRLGHVSIRLFQSETDQHLVGMTQEDGREGRKELFLCGYGMGILFHPFKGKLETRADLEDELQERAHQGKLSYLKVKIRPDQYRRLAEYLKAYESAGGCKIYGMPFRPRYAEGSGCTAFGASFLEVIGFILPEWRQAWTRTFLIPEELIGGKNRKYVSLFKLFFARKWAEPSQPHQIGFFWDMDLMHQWLVSIHQGLSTFSLPLEKESWHNARGLCFDATHLVLPDEPLILPKITA